MIKYNRHNTTKVKSLEYQVLTDYANDVDKAREILKVMEERYATLYNDIHTQQDIPNHVLRKYEGE